jgi:hypothetical protein
MPGPSQSQIDAHEERLQRVESNSEETRVDVGAIKISLEHSSKALDETRAELRSHIDLGFEKITEGQVKLAETLDKHGSILEKHRVWIETTDKKLQHKEIVHKSRVDVAKKIAIAGLLAAAGVVGTKIAEVLLGS